MLTKGEKSLLLNLLRGQSWETVTGLAGMLIRKIQEEPIDRTDAWTSAQSALSKEFRIEGIRAFLREMEFQANDQGT